MATNDDAYQKAGLGARVGFGKRPAIIVIDFQNAYSDPAADTGADASEQCKATRRLTDAGRDKNVRVFYFRCGYSKDGIDLGLWGEKAPSQRTVTRDSWGYQWNKYLDVREEDVQIEKHWPSVFFGTPLVPMLIPMHIDTLILCGTSTSGCVGASAIESVSYGFRTIIAKDAVCDRTQEIFDMFTWNMDKKFGDLSTTDECIEYIKGLEPLAYEFLK